MRIKHIWEYRTVWRPGCLHPWLFYSTCPIRETWEAGSPSAVFLSVLPRWNRSLSLAFPFSLPHRHKFGRRRRECRESGREGEQGQSLFAWTPPPSQLRGFSRRGWGAAFLCACVCGGFWPFQRPTSVFSGSFSCTFSFSLFSPLLLLFKLSKSKSIICSICSLQSAS